MDWKSLFGPLTAIGAPELGKLVGSLVPIPGGSFIGEAVGKMIAGALGVEATPAAVGAALGSGTNSDDVTIAKIKSVEDIAIARWGALAAMADSQSKTDISDITANKEVMVAQIASADMIPEGRWKTFLVIANAIWRPLFALEFLLECAYLFFGGVTGILHAIAVQQYGDIDQITKLMPLVTMLLLPYLAARFGILGYHMKLRTDEKEMAANVATGEAPGGAQTLDPKMLANIIKAVTGKK
jgi:hypothetical protein